MTVDPKSYDVAEYFLADFYPVPRKLTMKLAQAIQIAAEEWLGAAEERGDIHEREDGA